MYNKCIEVKSEGVAAKRMSEDEDVLADRTPKRALSNICSDPSF